MEITEVIRKVHIYTIATVHNNFSQSEASKEELDIHINLILKKQLKWHAFKLTWQFFMLYIETHSLCHARISSSHGGWHNPITTYDVHVLTLTPSM